MSIVQRVTLKRDFKGIPKGTTAEIVTSTEADHSVVQVLNALREQGYTDDEFEGILTSSYWEFTPLPNEDPAEVNESLAMYSKPVYAEKKAEKKEEKKSSGGGGGSSSSGDSIGIKILFSVIPLLEIWWILKAIFGLILWPFRAIFCSNCDYPWPTYNFSKW